MPSGACRRSSPLDPEGLVNDSREERHGNINRRRSRRRAGSRGHCEDRHRSSSAERVRRGVSSASTGRRCRRDSTFSSLSLERIAYRHNLKEHAVDIPEQICITRDNVQVGVDGVLYMKVLDAQRASYGIGDFIFAISQLAQTTLRSEIGKIDLDRTFEERGTINASVVMELDKASDPLGRQGSSLRDQEHQSPAGRALGDGEADACGAGEAGGDPHIRG